MEGNKKRKKGLRGELEKELDGWFSQWAASSHQGLEREENDQKQEVEALENNNNNHHQMPREDHDRDIYGRWQLLKECYGEKRKRLKTAVQKHSQLAEAKEIELQCLTKLLLQLKDELTGIQRSLDARESEHLQMLEALVAKDKLIDKLKTDLAQSREYEHVTTEQGTERKKEEMEQLVQMESEGGETVSKDTMGIGNDVELGKSEKRDKRDKHRKQKEGEGKVKKESPDTDMDPAENGHSHTGDMWAWQRDNLNKELFQMEEALASFTSVRSTPVKDEHQIKENQNSQVDISDTSFLLASREDGSSTPINPNFEDQLRTLNDKLRSAEERIKRKASFVITGPNTPFSTNNSPYAGLTPQQNGDSAKTMIAKEEYDTLEEEKNKIEEELWELKFAFEEERRKVDSLTNEKAFLEGYVAQLAEEMQKETAKMVEVKQQFQEQAASPARRTTTTHEKHLDAHSSVLQNGEALVGHTEEALAIELSMKNDEIQALKRSLGNELRQSEGEVISLRVDLQRVKHELTLKEGKMASLRLDMEKGKKMCANLEEEKTSMEERIKLLEEEIEVVKNREREGKDRLEQLEREKEKVESSLQRQKEESADWKENYRCIQEEKKTLEDKISMLEERANMLQVKVKSLESGCVTNTELQTRIEELEKQNQTVSSWANQMQEQAKELTKELEERKKLHSEELKKTRKKLEKEKEELSVNLQLEVDINKQFLGKLESLEKEKTQLKMEQSLQLKERLDRIEKQLQESTQQAMIAGSQKGAYEEQKKKVESEVAALRAELQQGKSIEMSLKEGYTTSLHSFMDRTEAQYKEMLSEAQQRAQVQHTLIEQLQEKLHHYESQPSITEQLKQEIRTRDRQLEILQRRFKEHRDLTQQANEAIKTQNHLLSKELERVETKSKEQLAMKSEVISNLERELDTLRAAYKSVLQQQSPQLNRSPPPKDPRTEQLYTSLRDELEQVKRELFYSIAVGIKLNMSFSGKSVNMNIISLYEKATEEQVPQKQWNSWIYDQLDKVAKRK